MCMMFYRRDTHVAEIQIGAQAHRVEDACAPTHFDAAKMPYVTLLCKFFTDKSLFHHSSKVINVCKPPKCTI